MPLDKVDLTDDNLLELRQFAPGEFVHVGINPAQPTVFDAAQRSGGGGRASQPKRGPAEVAGLVEEEDEEDDRTARVLPVRQWDFRNL
ncbi:MAG: hypothetical protein D9V47_11415 [Clostridia bacterium]|nr:MAG: hypothetical protein D9V47_11415 [Clostridia bacterium]